MKINWKVRFRNPVFLFQLLLAALLPVLAYLGISYADLTTWGSVLDVVVKTYTNPYLLVLMIISIYNAITDPTTRGVTDSIQAMRYENPKENDKW